MNTWGLLTSPLEAAEMPGPGSHSPGEERAASSHRGTDQRLSPGMGHRKELEGARSPAGSRPTSTERLKSSGKKGTEGGHRNEKPSPGRSGNPIN